jgi:hypothetical protein
MLCWLWWRVSAVYQTSWIVDSLVYLWIVLLCRIIKYIGHFQRYPGDLIYMPLIPIFGWYHSMGIKLHALFTLQVVCTKRLRTFNVNPNFDLRPRTSYAENNHKLTRSLQTAWGSRDGADKDDNHRMINLPAYADVPAKAGDEEHEETNMDDQYPLLPVYSAK